MFSIFKIMSSMRRRSEIVFLYACSTFVALLLSAIIVEAVGANWTDVWNSLLDGSLRKPGRWGKTLGSAVPMAMVAVGTIISTKAVSYTHLTLPTIYSV